MVADGCGGTEVSVAVIEGRGTVVTGADTAVAVTTGDANGVGLGVGVADTIGVAVGWTVESCATTVLGSTVGTRSSLVGVADTKSVAVGWTVMRRATTVRGGTVGTKGSRSSGLGRVTE